MDKPKIRVAVLYGGRSAEHEVSLISAKNVIQNLDRNRFDVVPIGISRDGAWFLGDSKKLQSDQTLALEESHKNLLFTPDCISQQISHDIIHTSQGHLFDVVFPVIHGVGCEDGTVQGLLEMAGVPYVGCGVLSSAIGMDKDVSKRLVSNAGLNVPPYVIFKLSAWEKNPDKIIKEITDKLTLPFFVKPANTGSSIGVYKVKQQKDLAAAIQKALTYDTKIIVEQGIDAIELELSVLESLEEGADPIVSVVGEIRANHEFYSYTAKYLDENGADLIIPAAIPEGVFKQAQEVAKQVFNVLECEGMSRIDLFLDRQTQRIYFNEVNTIPGFTQISMYPKLLEASGISYVNLLSHLIDLAMRRHEKKSKLIRNYIAEIDHVELAEEK